MVAVLSAGCSNALAGPGTGRSGGNKTATAQTDSSGGNNTAANHKQAVKFAECMRANGVREFPDPDASGTLTIDGIANRSSIDTSSAAFKQAIAQCIRDNGVKDFPDPTPDGPLVDTNRIPSAAGKGIAAINAAMQKCRDLAANAGAVGGQ
jgi:hypothetical protein